MILYRLYYISYYISNEHFCTITILYMHRYNHTLLLIVVDSGKKSCIYTDYNETAREIYTYFNRVPVS